MGDITVKLITELVEEKIVGTDLFIGEIKIKQGNNIQVFLDGDSGVTIEQCVAVSRHIEHNLDRTREDFELHVSSYGIGQPLKFLRQYKNAVGKQLSVITEESTRYSGKLVRADEQIIVLEIPATRKKDPAVPTEIPVSTIKTAKIEVVFN
ncbi:MAG: ribosome assembly cofactor RimP [Bacteroidales bacterium]|jgi:ribosome maturation factor RimP|nr:ribosome assembly cofactor RimP [Bacteroidales bacterium]